jgi:late competence protein required for DNA uptake (superfamily II DNA/RNA helicase)
MTISCERCKNEVFKYEACNYCGRKLCYSCIKSSQRPQKTTRLVICKDCWSSMRKRSAFKNKKTLEPAAK